MLKYLPGLLTAICWGISYSLIEKISNNVDKKIFLLTYSFISFIIYAIYNSSSGLNYPKLDFYNFNYFIFAIITMILGTFMSMKAIESSGATSAAVLEITYPIWCMLIMTFVFGQYAINFKALMGIILVFIGTFIFLIYENSH
jgi:hypothetical protein